jgi:hypothetical protein
MAMMAKIFSLDGFDAGSKTMKPSSFPEGTPKMHFFELSLM